MGVGWNLAALTEEEAQAAEKLWMELAKSRSQPDAECTADEVKQQAAWWHDAMGSILDATAKKIRICARSKRWWNTNIKKRRQAVGREKSRRQNSDEAARAKAELQKVFRQSEIQMFSEYFQNLRGAEVWIAARYANPRACMTMEAFTDRQGKQANTSLEKEQMLRHGLFAPNHHDQYYELRPADSPHTRVTDQIVE